MTKPTAYRTLIGATSIMGGASAITIAMAIAVSKGLAILTGPYGVGLMGLYGTVVAAACSSLSVGGGGIRFIAEANAKGNQEAVTRTMATLRWISLIFGALAGLLLWCLRNQLADWIFNDPLQAKAIGYLSAAAFLAIIAGSFVAQLTGMGRIWDLAKVTVSGSLISGAILLLLTRLYGSAAIVSGPLALQLITLVLAAYFVGRTHTVAFKFSAREVIGSALPIIKLGLALSAGVTMASMSQLLVRGAINHKLGPDAMGHFQAAWSISMTYIGFVLSAMAVDYFPRLSAIISDGEASRRLLNQQTTLAFVAACPIFLALFALAPWIIRLLYSTDFGPSVSVLRWQILGDVFKLAAWPLGFFLLAANRPRAYLLVELMWNVSYVSLTWVLLDYFGLEATGIGFALSYMLYLVIVCLLARSQLKALWNRSNRIIIALMPAAIGILFAINHKFPAATLPLGLLLTAAGGAATLWSIRYMLKERDFTAL